MVGQCNPGLISCAASKYRVSIKVQGVHQSTGCPSRYRVSIKVQGVHQKTGCPSKNRVSIKVQGLYALSHLPNLRAYNFKQVQKKINHLKMTVNNKYFEDETYL